MKKLLGALLSLLLPVAAQAQTDSYLASNGTFKTPFALANTWTALQTFNGGVAGSFTLANANLANMAAGTTKCKPVGATAGAPQDCAYTVVNATDAPYNADPSGVTDSTAPIQNTINACPSNGCIVALPTTVSGGCNYKISAALTIGNGTASAGSTTRGVILMGMNNPVTPFVLGGFPVTACKITWAGAAADMLQVLGPLQGWGVRNLFFDCAATAASAIHVRSAQAGDSANLVLNNCLKGVLSDTVAVFSPFTNTDSYQNRWYGLYITVANVANSVGITLTGTTSSNTDYNTFINTAIAFAGNCTGCVGVSNAASDSNHFINLQFPGASGSNITCMVFDYTILNSWPASTTIDGIDTGNPAAGCATSYSNVSTPGAGAKPNYLTNVVETNGGIIPNIANLAVYSSSKLVLSTGANNPNTVLAGTTAGALQLGTNGGVGGFLTLNGATSGSISLAATATGGTLQLGSNATVTAAGGIFGTGLNSGINGGTGGTLLLNGATSGSVTQNVPAVAGTPTVTWGSSTGTPAVTASSPLTITAATGNISITSPLPVANGGTGDTGTAWTSFSLSPSCGTATFANVVSTSKTIGKVTYAKFRFTISAIGTCAGNLTINLPNTSQGGASLVGQEFANSGFAVPCSANAAATMTCTRVGSTVNAWALNDDVRASGVYENQ